MILELSNEKEKSKREELDGEEGFEIYVGERAEVGN